MSFMKPIPKPNPNKVLIEDHCQKIETAMLPVGPRRKRYVTPAQSAIIVHNGKAAKAMLQGESG